MGGFTYGVGGERHHLPPVGRIRYVPLMVLYAPCTPVHDVAGSIIHPWLVRERLRTQRFRLCYLWNILG